MTGNVRHLATHVCVPDRNKWGEPFIVSAEPPGHACEPPPNVLLCNRPAAWFVEVVGYTGRDPVPGNHPVVYVCGPHLAETLETWPA